MALETRRLDNVPIFAAGTHNGDGYTRRDLDMMVQAFNTMTADGTWRPFLKLGHEDAQEDPEVATRVFGVPALGYVSKLWRAGDFLFANFEKVPKRVAEIIEAGAFSARSAEVFWDYVDRFGRKWPRALKAVAFLGAQIPAVENLSTLESLFYQRQQAVHAYARDAVLYAEDEWGRKYTLRKV